MNQYDDISFYMINSVKNNISFFLDKQQDKV